MDYLMQLGLFGGKAVVLVVAIAIILVVFFALLSRARQSKTLLSVENLNDKFEDMAEALNASILDGKTLKLERKKQKKRAKSEKKAAPKDQPTVYVLDFEGDIRASHLEHLREEITSILTVARPGKDEVVVRLESPGGMVHSYGLAAAQLVRLRSAGLQLTVCVDKIAASGGYMMACTADRILAAPFAIIGSIGVVAQVPNFHRLLKKHDVDFEEVTAGEFKRTVSLFGEITDKGKRKFLEQIEDTHGLFKDFVHAYRPQLDLDQVATGEYWFGERAKQLRLVDEITSSDDYLFRRRNEVRIFKIEVTAHKKWSEKLAENIAAVFEKTLEHTLSKSQGARWF
jgi:serine protease SohB